MTRFRAVLSAANNSDPPHTRARHGLIAGRDLYPRVTALGLVVPTLKKVFASSGLQKRVGSQHLTNLRSRRRSSLLVALPRLSSAAAWVLNRNR